MRLIDVLDTDDTISAPIRAARVEWLHARERLRRAVAEEREARREVTEALQRWQAISREMRPDGQAPE
jgi:hypothetical protein